MDKIVRRREQLIRALQFIPPLPGGLVEGGAGESSAGLAEFGAARAEFGAAGAAAQGAAGGEFGAARAEFGAARAEFGTARAAGGESVTVSIIKSVQREPVLRTAAVLVPFILRDSGYTVLFTKRSEGLSDHAGQISFPGGCTDHRDHSLIDTAKRETFEEVGIAQHSVEVITTLSTIRTGTGFIIHPVVGLVDSSVQMVANPSEVEQVFEVPLTYLLGAENYRQELIQTSVGPRQCETIHYQNHRIWGATAAIITSFRLRIAAFAKGMIDG